MKKKNEKSNKKTYGDSDEDKWKEFRLIVLKHRKNMTLVAEEYSDLNVSDCTLKWAKRKEFRVRGPWDPVEDELLLESMRKPGNRKGTGYKWSKISNSIPGRIGTIFQLPLWLTLTGKQCRERWVNHIGDSVNREKFSSEEEKKIQELQKKHGNRWALIAKKLGNGRTDNMVKNRWYCVVSKLPENEGKKRKKMRVEAHEMVKEKETEVEMEKKEKGVTRKRKRRKRKRVIQEEYEEVDFENIDDIEIDFFRECYRTRSKSKTTPKYMEENDVEPLNVEIPNELGIPIRRKRSEITPNPNMEENNVETPSISGPKQKDIPRYQIFDDSNEEEFVTPDTLKEHYETSQLLLSTDFTPRRHPINDSVFLPPPSTGFKTRFEQPNSPKSQLSNRQITPKYHPNILTPFDREGGFKEILPMRTPDRDDELESFENNGFPTLSDLIARNAKQSSLAGQLIRSSRDERESGFRNERRRISRKKVGNLLGNNFVSDFPTSTTLLSMSSPPSILKSSTSPRFLINSPITPQSVERENQMTKMPQPPKKRMKLERRLGKREGYLGNVGSDK